MCSLALTLVRRACVPLFSPRLYEGECGRVAAVVYRCGEALMRAHCHMSWMIDTSKIHGTPATLRKSMAEHLKRFDELRGRWNAGAASVVANPWLRRRAAPAHEDLT